MSSCFQKNKKEGSQYRGGIKVVHAEGTELADTLRLEGECI